MSGFWVWAASPAGSLVFTLCALAGGLGVGAWWGIGHGREQGCEDGYQDAVDDMKWARDQAPMWEYRARNPDLAGQVVQLPEVAHELFPEPGPYPWPERCGPDPRAEVLEPTAVLAPPVDLSWTGEMSLRFAEFERDMERLIGGTDDQLRAITR